MSTPDLSQDFSADCSNCAALCCLALAFDAGDRFAHDKPAGMPCHNLHASNPRQGCTIHKDLTSAGYSGCVAYDCLGAGQRVTALFSETWKDTPRLAGPMMQAFRIMRDVQDLGQMLEASKALPLPKPIQNERADWLGQLCEVQDNLEALQAFETDGTAGQIRVWLRGLASHIQR
jgi:hypothetical protein